MATHYDLRGPKLRRYRGDTHAENFTITDSSGFRVDLTGAAVTFTVKRHTHATQALIQRSSSDPTEVDVTAHTQGEVSVLFDPAEMAALEPRTYVYDLQVILADGTIHTVAADEFIVSADITN